MTNKVNITVGFSVEGIRSAAKNAEDLREVIVDVPCVDPRELRIDDEIFGLKIVPVDDKVKKIRPSTACTVGVITVNVDSLNGAIKNGYITVNGSIDIPKDIGRTNKLEDIFFNNKEDARQIALILVEEEYNKAEEAVKEAQKIRDFLSEQMTAQRV